MRALITGATGFVGRHLAKHLKDKGDEVVPLVRSPTGIDGAVVSDICKPDKLTAAITKVRPTVIYHLAAQARADLSSQDVWRGPTFDTNVYGTANVLEAALKCEPPPRVLVIGSSEQYGWVANDHDVLDETAALRPLTPYGLSKMAAELVAHHFGSPTSRSLLRRSRRPQHGDARVWRRLRSIRCAGSAGPDAIASGIETSFPN